MVLRRRLVEWPAWRYGPDGEAAQFERPEDVPDGWKNKPQLQFETPEAKTELCKETAIEKLQAVNIKVDPRWGKARLWEEVEKVLSK